MASTAAAPTACAPTGMSPALKEALLAAFVTFVLLAPCSACGPRAAPAGHDAEFHFGWVVSLG